MDGRSIVKEIVDPSDPLVPAATRSHILRAQASDARPWRTFHPIEFIALNNHTWFGHLIDDVVSNTYRALRFVHDPTYGELLYAEFTSVQDWHYDTPVHFELFNMTVDPHQVRRFTYFWALPLVSRLACELGWVGG